MQTLQHIPFWVFFVLLGLIAMGLQQTRTRQLRSRRLMGINIALTLITLAGVAQLWRDTPWLLLGLLSWAATCLMVILVLGQGAAPTGAAYEASTRRFTVPGSWWPLALFMTIFATKFVVGMLTATQADVLHSLGAAIGISAAYGLFSGILNARAWRLLKLQWSV